MMHIRWNLSAKLLLLLVGTFLFIACGGETEAPPPPVDLSFQGSDDFQFTPPDVSVEAGSAINITFENSGVLEHSWVLVSDRIAPEDVTESDALGGATTGIIASGETTTISFSAPPAGEYQIVCAVPGHAIGGMVGTFTVTERN